MLIPVLKSIIFCTMGSGSVINIFILSLFCLAKVTQLIWIDVAESKIVVAEIGVMYLLNAYQKIFLVAMLVIITLILWQAVWEATHRMCLLLNANELLNWLRTTIRYCCRLVCAVEPMPQLLIANIHLETLYELKGSRTFCEEPVVKFPLLTRLAAGVLVSLLTYPTYF